jgi:glycosyltransferase involved in cell wall biosynthesis
MRILVVNWLDPRAPHAGGAEVHLKEVFGRLAGRGHDVTVLASGGSGLSREDTIDGIRIIRCGNRYTFALAWPLALRRAGGLTAFDVVVENLNKLPLGLARVSARSSVVLLHHLWGESAFQAARLPVALLTWVAERIMLRAYRDLPFIVVSQSGRTELVDQGVNPGRISVIENGVSPPADPPAGEAERAAVPTFVFVGRLQRYKRLDLLLRALALLQAEGYGCRAVIAGRGPDEARLKRLAMRYGVSSLVDFPGQVSDAERRRLFRMGWAHVQPSRKEGWGLTVMEAATEGTCTVAANVPGLCDSVVHLVTGLLVPHPRLPTFLDALRYLVRHPREAWRMGRVAHSRARLYTWDQAALGVEAALERVALARPFARP